MWIGEIFKKLFVLDGKKYYSSRLGELVFSRESKDWVGSFGEINFYIIHEFYTKEPSTEILDYAYGVLNNIPMLNKQFDEEKLKWSNEFLDEKLNIDALRITQLVFSRLPGVGYKTYAVLDPEYDKRHWELMFINDEPIKINSSY